jgi:hypothetical protein
MIEGSGSGSRWPKHTDPTDPDPQHCFSYYLPKAVAREDHMMTSGERSMAAGMARPRAAAKLPQNVAVISAPSCLERPGQGTNVYYRGIIPR